MRLFLFIAWMHVAVPYGLAEKTPDRFVISGIVMDPSHASIPGATLLLRKGTNAPEQSLVTDDTGVFRFAPVDPGRYEIEISRNSFRKLTQRVTVRDRDITSLRVTLPLAQLNEMVVASDRAEQVNTNPGENLDVVNLDRKALGDLPMLDQDVIGAVSAFLDSAALGSGGASVVVNGMETSEKGVSASAIKEVKINQNPYSAEFSRPGAGASRLSPRLKPMPTMGPSTSCFATITWTRATHSLSRGLPNSGESLKAILPGLSGAAGRRPFSSPPIMKSRTCRQWCTPARHPVSIKRTSQPLRGKRSFPWA